MRVLLFAAGREFGERRVPGVPEIERPHWREEVAFLRRVLDEEHALSPVGRVVHGGCTIEGEPAGGDRRTTEWCLARGVQCVIYPACFPALGGPAGRARIANMINEWSHQIDKLIALPGGHGTGLTVRMATTAGLKLRDERGWKPGGGT